MRRVRTTHPLILSQSRGRTLPQQIAGAINQSEDLFLMNGCVGLTAVTATNVLQPNLDGSFVLDLNRISDTFLSSTMSDSQDTPALSDQSPLVEAHQLSFWYFPFNDASSLAPCR